MKFIIRFLARISGVENEIRKNERFEIGCTLSRDMHWWTGFKGCVSLYLLNAFYFYAKAFKNNSSPHIQRVRDEVYEIGNKIHSELK